LAAAAIVRGDYLVYLIESKKVAELAKDQIGLEAVKAGQRGFAGGGKPMLESMRQVLEKYYQQGLVDGYYVAKICALLGRNQEAIHYLQEALTSHDPTIIEIKCDPAFHNLHDDPSFRNLVLRIGLPPE
jgi:hypothetical protein